MFALRFILQTIYAIALGRSLQLESKDGRTEKRGGSIGLSLCGLSLVLLFSGVTWTGRHSYPSISYYNVLDTFQ